MSEQNEWNDGLANEGWFDPSNPWTPLPGVRTGTELTRGEKAADWVRNRMGSWGFVWGFAAFMLIWAALNSWGIKALFDHRAFDPYPYILLNLLLSTLAGLQGAILLIAAKRADAIAAEQAFSHLSISKASSEIIHRVEQELSANSKVTHELHEMHRELREMLKEKK